MQPVKATLLASVAAFGSRVETNNQIFRRPPRRKSVDACETSRACRPLALHVISRRLRNLVALEGRADITDAARDSAKSRLTQSGHSRPDGTEDVP
jgi:hypothetical protein